MTVRRLCCENAFLRSAWVAALAVLAGLLVASGASAGDDLAHRALAIEPALYGYPQSSLLELEALMPRAEAASGETRRLVYGLYGQAMVLAGKASAAAQLADRMEEAAKPAQDFTGLATARLIRSTIESAHGDAAKSLALAREARVLVKGSNDVFLQYWAALAYGTSARMRGQSEEAMDALHEALSFADQAGNAYRRSTVQYQLSVLHAVLKQGEEAFAAAVAGYDEGRASNSVYAMANAKMAESSAMDLLRQPKREVAAMEESLAIARKGRSEEAEGRALVNLADIYLRRKSFGAALDVARQSLALARKVGDTTLTAASKANMGFALLGSGHVAEGKRLTDEALADYERTSATADIADLVEEYGTHLERLGDYEGALKLYHREQALKDEIAQETQVRALLEVQQRYEADKRNREISLLARENRLKTSELANRELEQRVWWSLVGLFALSFAVVVVLYRKLQSTNRLLAEKNTELAIQSTRDPLTGLYNRRYFQNFINAEDARPERRRREDDHTVRALLLIDIDHFKETNDRFGHALGDSVLVAVADRLRAALRETDMIVRWGGEEFLILATTHARHVDDLATRILHTISAQPITLEGKVVRTTASIGYAPIPLPPGEVTLAWDKAIGLVDMALYMAKMHGRNRAYGVRRLLKSDAESLAAMERDLENASKSGIAELAVVYGPYGSSAAQVDLQPALDPPLVPHRFAANGD